MPSSYLTGFPLFLLESRSRRAGRSPRCEPVAAVHGTARSTATAALRAAVLADGRLGVR